MRNESSADCALSMVRIQAYIVYKLLLHQLNICNKEITFVYLASVA